MIRYNNKRVGKRAGINIEDLHKPFYVLYQTPFHGSFLRQVDAETKEEAKRLCDKEFATHKNAFMLIDIRDALATLEANSSDS